MWCPDCKIECEQGQSVCPECGAAFAEVRPVLWGWAPIGKLSDSWPRDDAGEFVPPAFLTHCLCIDMQDEMLINMLAAYGIPAIRQYPEDGSFGRVILGMSGNGTDIYVPQTLIEDALALISDECEIEEDGNEL